MPPHHIAGVQVLLRCLAAETEPHLMDLTDGFQTSTFAHAVRALGGPRRYTSLVPTQLVRVLADADAARAAAELDAILVGGAPSSPSLLRQAREAGLRVVTTYGMSETSGGCVYDGTPLRGTTIRVDDGGRILLGGDTLATGYLGRSDLTSRAFHLDNAGHRWFHTDDVGHQGPQGRWHVDGRIDDLIITGGLKVAPRVVEEALVEHVRGVAEAVVVGMDDEEWGQVVCAAVTCGDSHHEPSLARARAALRGILPDHALPRRLLVLTTLPLRGPGKPDRQAVRAALVARATMEP
jgi:O-succinylbenzoic acid--CoA ligase